MTLRDRDVRALRLGALLVVPALVYVYAVAPAARAIMRRRQDVTRAQAELTRDRDLVHSMAAARAEQGATTAWLGREARRLFNAPDDIGATSGLADAITDAATDAGLQLRQTETRPAVAAGGGLRAVRIDLRGEGDARAILTFLSALEDGDHLIRLDRLAISHIGSVNTKALPRLSMTAAVYGYALIPSPSGVRVLSSDAGAPYEPRPSKKGATTPHAVSLAAIDVTNAITNDPFSPDRGARAAQLRKPPPPPPPPAVHLVGTVVGRTGAFAMCQIGDAPPRVVRLGEHVAGYVLRDIQRGRVTLADASGHETQLTIPTPGA